MQILRLSIYFLLFIAKAQAQPGFAWYPIQPSVQYNYKVDSSALPFSVIIRIDSIESTTPIRYHLNKIVIACDTCINAQLVNDFFDSTYILIHQPQFLGHYFSKIAGNAFYFKGKSSFILRPCDTLGSSWLFDSTQNITATIIAKTAQPVLSVPDSLVIIRLSTNDTLICSKNAGLLRFPFKITGPHFYQLAGYEGAMNAGIKLKRFHDFFDFNAGDVLQYTFRDDDYNSYPPILKGGRDKWTILSASVYSDSVVCTVKQTYLDSLQIGGGIPVFTAYTTTFNIAFRDSAQHLSNVYPSQEITVSPYFIYNNGTRYIHKAEIGLDSRSKITKSFGQNCPDEYLDPGASGAAEATLFPNLFLNRNSSRIVGRELAEGLGFTSELFNNYATISQRCLVGFVKGGQSSGTVYNDDPLSIKPISALQSRYICYPNPAADVVTIAGQTSSRTHASILNAIGESIQKVNLTEGQWTHPLSTSALANGIYFIVISTSTSKEVKKLIIQH